MKLKTLEIKNFRCFESLSIDLDEQLTVLVAKNGQGKSTVLDAIRIGLWAFVSGFDLARNSQNDPANGIRIDDVRVLKMRDGQMARQLPCNIEMECDWDLNELGHWNLWELNVFGAALTDLIRISKWMRYRESEAKGSKTKDDGNTTILKSFVSFLQNQIRNPENPDTDLPVIGYYGTGRLWSQKKLTKDKKQSKQNADVYMRLFAYRDCLDPASSYKHFEEWFIWIFECYWEERFKQEDKGLSPDTNSKWKDIILVVQQAIDEVLQVETVWHDLEYSISDEKSLVLNHDSHGKLKVEQLSDGIRNTLAMVADIAYRCIKLNPHLGLNAAKETHGIVMIDEIEMHLHPAWQQSILGSLIKAFPNIQFIVTTHSPQVLTSVKTESIRELSADYKVLTPSINTYGEESKVVLEDLMHVSSRPPTEENELLQNYLKRINHGDIDSSEVVQWRQTLEKAFGSEYSKLKLADMVINKWKAKRGTV